MSKIEEIKASVTGGKTKLIEGLVQEALNEGNTAEVILKAMIDSMGIIGEKFSASEIFVPEMLISAKTMSKGVGVLKPHLVSGTASSLGTCVIGTVAGDLHDIGKNLVAMMLESSGFNVIDLGVDVSETKFVNAVKENKNVKIVACSGLLTTTMPAMKKTIEALKESGINGFKVMVGGAPVTAEFAASIGADAYTPDAGSAAVKAKELATA